MTAVALTWTGSRRGLRLRLFDRKGRPGDWQDVSPACPCGADTGTSRAGAEPPPHRALVLARGSYGYQLDFTTGVHVTSAVAIDAGQSEPSGEPDPTDSPSAKATDEPPTGGSKSLVFPPTDLITRAEWGADESKRFTEDGSESSPIRFSKAQAITIHHTATDLNDPDPAATVRAIYEQHAVSNDWGDIGYHFLIDHQGRIYEGRYSGKDSKPAHNTRGEVVTAFHTIGFNPGNIGIALLGDFTEQKQTPEMRDSLVRLTASLASLHDLNPQSSIDYRSITSGKITKGPALAGHQDWTSTECPGKSAYLSLDRIRKDVALLSD